MSSKNEIAIFVSHRIDLPCETPNSDIYHPVRCGAVFDSSDAIIPGDNTGDNISDKRLSYCELTVQYWAWKNYTADYYGLCHYRRYFSFSDEIFKQERFNVIESKTIRETISKYNLEDTSKIRNEIERNDAIIPYGIDVRTVLTGVPGGKRFYPHNVIEFWKAKTDQIDPACLDKLVDIVKSLYPEYYPCLLDYLNGTLFFGGCCYVLKKDLFNKLCEFQFHVLDVLVKNYDMSSYVGELVRQPGFMGEILYATFLFWMKREHYKITEHQLVYFTNYQVKKENVASISLQNERKMCKPNSNRNLYIKLKRIYKRIFLQISPAYRCSRRIEKKIDNMNNVSALSSVGPIASSVKKSRWDHYTLTSNIQLNIACMAQEIADTHKASFSEFRRCNTGRDVVIVATGPSMCYYTPIPNAIHIGVNAAFKNPKIKLDYYFTTDFESRNDWFFDIKNYDFIKFFGQYSAGVYRDRFQVVENIIEENQGRRFFQAAPSEDIHINIEYYPLMGFYSVAFQAIHFAIYTNASRIFLVGCDCSQDGYFNGKTQNYANLPKWLKGYEKVKAFVERFYPETEIISLNPVGLRGMFRDVYTENYLTDHFEIDPSTCETLNNFLLERTTS